MGPGLIHALSVCRLDPRDYERYLAGLPTGEADVVLQAKNYVVALRSACRQLHEQNFSSQDVMMLQSLGFDRLIKFLFARVASLSSHCVVAALGGYGRAELNLYSDIDLLFLHADKDFAAAKKISETVLYVLWDLQLEVGYAIRTVAECCHSMLTDNTVLTSMLDARFLSGEEALFKNFIDEFRWTLERSSVTKDFVEKKLAERRTRLQKYGGSVYILEPNVKEGEGGLRDLHYPLWFAKVFGYGTTYGELANQGWLTVEEKENLTAAQQFFCRIRNELHLQTGRKRDQLTFDQQEAMATKIGFVDGEGALAVERFMKFYYQMAAMVSSISQDLVHNFIYNEKPKFSFLKYLRWQSLDDDFRIHKNIISMKRPQQFKKNPLLLLKAYAWVQKKRGVLDNATRKAITEVAQTLGDNFATDPTVCKLLRQMMSSYRYLGETLLQMHESRFFEILIPEFKKIRCQVQHDAYHIYTVDTHSLLAVGELSGLAEGKLGEKFMPFRESLLAIRHPDLLTFGLLFHDIGKGDGKNHSVTGAVIAKKFAQRMGFAPREQETVEFLVLSHLIMPHLSQRRDLDDDRLIQQFANSIENVERLKMLYCLTFADIRAVGPEAWTDWKGNLLTKLYTQALARLAGGGEDRAGSSIKVEKVRQQVLALASNQEESVLLAQFLDNMVPRYFMATQPEWVLEHYRWLMAPEDRRSIVRHKTLPEQGVSLIEIYFPYTPRLFCWVAGTLSVHHINILNVDIFRLKNGMVLLSIKATDASGSIIQDDQKWLQLEKTLLEVLEGRVKMNELIKRSPPPLSLQKKPVQRAESKVFIDNDVSAYYTVIDVYTQDRLGLLYDITQTLSDLGCVVDISKVSTKVEQVADSFYMKDIFGQKITDKKELAKIRSAILGVVASPDQSGLAAPVDA